MLNVLLDKNTKGFIITYILINILNLIGFYYCITSSRKISVFIPVLLMMNSLLFLVEEGILIDKEFNRYKNYKSLLGFKYGKWKPLPNYSYISVFKATRVQKTSQGLNINYHYFNVYEINVFDNNNYCTTLLDLDIEHLQNAKNGAYQIASYLKLPLLDATEAENKWVDTL